MQVEVFSTRGYTARNPPWTRLGKKGKPMWNVRKNGQKPGLEGLSPAQGAIRVAFATTAYNHLYQQYGKDARGMPIVADLMQQYFPTNLRKSLEQKLQERRAKAAQSHKITGAKLSGAGGPITPAGNFPSEYY